jgi:thiol-disulfide isomerase/thioredoxin
MKTFLGRLLLVAALCGVCMPGRAALYTVGAVVENFSLTDRATGKPVQLTDFAGKIVVLDWFAWWCPFCQAAAPQLLSGIDEWYAARGGNPAGIPVVHVGVNLQPGQETQTQNFVTRAKLDLVLQDFNRALANRVATDGQPIFAIINGVINSPTHKPWELLYSRRGYGQTTFPVADFRAAIDAVKAPVAVPPTPPSITGSPTSQTVNPGAEVVFSVTAIGTPTLSYQWRKHGVELPGETRDVLALAKATAADADAYDVVVTNPAGSVVSAAALLVVRVPRVLGVPAARPDGSLLFSVRGGAGSSFQLESSADLETWISHGEQVPAGSDGAVTVPAGDLSSGRFFRIVVR